MKNELKEIERKYCESFEKDAKKYPYATKVFLINCGSEILNLKLSDYDEKYVDILILDIIKKIRELEKYETIFFNFQEILSGLTFIENDKKTLNGCIINAKKIIEKLGEETVENNLKEMFDESDFKKLMGVLKK